MLDSFGKEMIQIKQKFESKLTESLQSVSDDYLNGLFSLFSENWLFRTDFKSEIRKLDVEIIKMSENSSRRKKDSNPTLRADFCSILERKIEKYLLIDHQICLETLKLVRFSENWPFSVNWLH